MAQQEHRFPYERRVDDLARTYRAVQRDLVRQVRRALESDDLRTAARRRVQLAAVLATLDQLAAETDPVARELVREAYEQAADHAQGKIVHLGVTPAMETAFAGVSTEAVIALQDAVLGRLADARRTIGRTVDDAYRRAGLRAAQRAVLGADGSPQKAKRELMRELLRTREVQQAMQHGGAALVDRGGKRWALSTYAEMVVRTTTREAVTQGTIDRLLTNDIGLARVSEHASACHICVPYQGKLVALDGNTEPLNGELVMDAARLPPFHPNCRHSIAPVVRSVEATRARMRTYAPA